MRKKLIKIIKEAGDVADAVGMKDWVIKDIADAIIKNGLLKDNKIYQLEFHGYGDWRCPKCGKHFGGYFEANYCSNCGIKFKKEQ